MIARRCPTLATPGNRAATTAVASAADAVDPDLDNDVRAWFGRDPARPRIAVLGTIEVHAPGVVHDRRRMLTELLVYLAAHDARGVRTDQLDAQFWIAPSSRRVLISQLRRWLSTTANGQLWLPHAGTKRRYRLVRRRFGSSAPPPRMETANGIHAPQIPRGLRHLPRPHPLRETHRQHGIDHWRAGCG
jgi:hypothetical protein